MKPFLKQIIASLFFASLLIISSLLLKNQEAGYLVTVSIYMAWAYFFFRTDTKGKSCLAKPHSPA